jgi:hypothetical protein
MKTNKIIKYASVTIASLVLAFFILLLSMYVIKPLLNGWPLTVEQAANKVISQMDQESLTRLKAMKKEDLIMLHMGFGQGIRNDFGLWRGNMLLLRNTGTHHPDDASMVIIEAAWQKLRKN